MSIRRPGLTGWRQVDALWFPRERFDEAASQQQIIRHWQTGSRAYRFAEGDVLCFRTPVAMSCDRLSSWPLVRQGRALCSAWLEPAEISQLPLADLWLIRDARAHALNLADGRELQPGQWFDLGDYGLLDTYDCTEALPDAVLETWEPQDIRQVLGDVVGAPSAERDSVLKALELAGTSGSRVASGALKGSAAAGRSQGRVTVGRTWLVPGLVAVVILLIYWQDPYGTPVAPGTRPPAVTTATAGGGFDPLWFLGSAGVVTAGLWLLRRFMRQRIEAERQALVKQARARQQTPAGQVASPTATSGASVPERRRHVPALLSRWRQWLKRMAMASHLDALLNRQHAAYMRRMLEMFERGDIEAALRHAIPMGGNAASEQALGALKARDNLTVGHVAGRVQGVDMAEDLKAHLLQLYRRTFGDLDRKGRIEEAVYVLAELLHARQEALDYLEKHQRYKQAAELALTWDMQPSTIVRLLCLADDWQRAVLVARRDKAFAAAVLSLQADWPEAAERLRLEWAEMLVGQGDWLGAVEVIWPLPVERERARQWLLAAEAAGGSLAAAALVKRAVLLPDTLAVHGPYLRALRDDPERADERAVLAIELICISPSTHTVRSLAAAVVHAVLADHGDGHPGITAKDMSALVKLSGDELLKLDMPKGAIAGNEPVGLRPVVPPLHWSAPAPGSRALHDVVPLRDDHYLAALGESGAVMLDRLGSIRQRFAVPATRLVIAGNRRVALALAQRDTVWRISRLDLVTGQARDLGVLPLEFFARRFDGLAWTIASRGQVRVVDVDRDFATLWHVSDLPGDLMSLEASADHEYWLLSLADGTTEQWTYRLPERRLLHRERATKRIRPETSLYRYSLGEYLEYWLEPVAGAGLELVVNGSKTLRRFRLDERLGEAPEVLFGNEQWLVAQFMANDGNYELHFMSRSQSQLCAILQWPSEEYLRCRQVGSDWVFFDWRGRLFHVNVETGLARGLSIR
ncbi:bpX6 domain-containing protein [Pseudomonas asplenii]|uniref:bpX6 domain-containing protein n=2 Tax=Pseudomonas TaxID=286 RepID=UPI002362E259|nr:bpX6 domain-containing protein [Pseudomonas asplenii]